MPNPAYARARRLLRLSLDVPHCLHAHGDLEVPGRAECVNRRLHRRDQKTLVERLTVEDCLDTKLWPQLVGIARCPS